MSCNTVGFDWWEPHGAASQSGWLKGRRLRRQPSSRRSVRLVLEGLENRLALSSAPTPVGPTAADLIAAIDKADLTGGPVVLELAAKTTYTLTAPDNNWYGPNGLPAIGTNITIQGNGATIARAGGAPAFRLFYVSGGMPGELPLGELTLKN
jgi:hypothetical protein